MSGYIEVFTSLNETWRDMSVTKQLGTMGIIITMHMFNYMFHWGCNFILGLQQYESVATFCLALSIFRVF